MPASGDRRLTPKLATVPNMPEHKLAPLIERFAQAVSDARKFIGMFAASVMRE